jgi:hypothetical protein
MMTRWIAASAGALAVTLALAIAPPFVSNASADGVAAPAPRAAFTRKRCIAPAMWWGRGQTTWVCNIAETCCYDRLLRRGSCLPASQRCF